jgi:anti-sigma factor ChrR (cupin superfamily)
MSVHPNLQELELYRRGHLPPVELLELDAHVSACSECQARMSPHLRTLQDAVMGAAGQHLSYDLMER